MKLLRTLQNWFTTKKTAPKRDEISDQEGVKFQFDLFRSSTGKLGYRVDFGIFMSFVHCFDYEKADKTNIVMREPEYYNEGKPNYNFMYLYERIYDRNIISCDQIQWKLSENNLFDSGEPIVFVNKATGKAILGIKCHSSCESWWIVHKYKSDNAYVHSIEPNDYFYYTVKSIQLPNQ